MERQVENSLRSFLLELVVYIVLVAAYYFLVLQLLGHWLADLFTHQRRAYAGIALGLIAGQGFLLETLTRLLLGWTKARTEEE